MALKICGRGLFSYSIVCLFLLYFRVLPSYPFVLEFKVHFRIIYNAPFFCIFIPLGRMRLLVIIHLLANLIGALSFHYWLSEI